MGRELVGQWDVDLWSCVIKTSFSLNPAVHRAVCCCTHLSCLGVALCSSVCVTVYAHPKFGLFPAQELGLAVLLLGNSSVLVPWGDWEGMLAFPALGTRNWEREEPAPALG